MLGQFNLGFIIGRLKDDLFILDQHACDEKFRFIRNTKELIMTVSFIFCNLFYYLLLCIIIIIIIIIIRIIICIIIIKLVLLNLLLFRFENLQRSTKIHQQPLISPINLSLSAAQEAIIMDNMDIFEANGFKIRTSTSPDDSNKSTQASTGQV